MSAVFQGTGRERLGKAWTAVATRLINDERDPVEIFESMLGVCLLGLKQSLGGSALSTELRILADCIDRGDTLAIRVLLGGSPIGPADSLPVRREQNVVELWQKTARSVVGSAPL
jgi:hypothetical protein